MKLEDLLGNQGPQERRAPEHRLLISIFLTALKDYVAPEATLSSKDKRTARQYFERVHRKHYGSLDHFCLELDCDVAEVLARVEKVTQARLEELGIIVRRQGG